MKNVKLFVLLILVSFSAAKAQTPTSYLSVSQDTDICIGTSAVLDAYVDSATNSTTAYTVSPIPFSPLPVNAANTVTGLTDDHYYGPFPIGFDFCFFGATYNQFYVGSNGWICFTPFGSTNYDPWVTGPIPATTNGNGQQIPRNSIMGPWRDWYPGAQGQGTIQYGTYGTAPNRILKVSFIGLPLFSCTSSQGTFQIVLHETTNIIDNHLINVPTCPTWNSGNGVQGIQNVSGTVAYTVPGRNNTLWTAQNESYRYVPSGPPNTTITWTDNFGNSYTGANITVNPLVQTTYTASLDVCPNAVTASVVVSPIACGYLTGTHTDVTCWGGSNGTATVVINDGFGPYDFEWSNGSTTYASNDSMNTITNLPAGNYSVTVYSFNGASMLDTTITIGQPPAISLNIDGTPETCPNASDGTISVHVNNGTPGFTYSIQGVTPVNIPLSDYVFENLATGTYNVTVTDMFGCLATGQYFVDELSMSFVTNNSEIKCHGDTNAFASIDVSGGTSPYTYFWSNGGNTPGITNLSAGTYCVTVFDENACSISACVTFTEPDPVLLYTSTDQTICLSQSASIVSAPIGGTPPYEFFWNPGGYALESITVSPYTTTEYCVYVQDFNWCKSPERCVTIFVNPPLEIESEIYEDTICKGDTTMIDVSLTGGNGGPYFIELMGGPIVDPPFEVSPDHTQKYIVVGSDGCGTPAVLDTLSLVVNDPPQLNVSANKVKGCPPLEVRFTDDSPDIGQSWYWDFDDGDFFNYSVDQNPVHVFRNPGLYEITVTATSPLGCSTTQTLFEQIEVYPKPNTSFSSDQQNVSIADPVIEFFNETVDAQTFFWIFGDGDSLMVENPGPHEFPPVPGEYTVALITENINGCRDTAYMVITLEDQEDVFYAPNVFNPLSVISENREFKPFIGMLDESNYNLQIYNRWGELVFESNEYQLGWTGRDKNGAFMPSGMYTYLCVYKDKTGNMFQKTGVVNLIY